MLQLWGKHNHLHMKHGHEKMELEQVPECVRQTNSKTSRDITGG